MATTSRPPAACRASSRYTAALWALEHDTLGRLLDVGAVAVDLLAVGGAPVEDLRGPLGVTDGVPQVRKTPHDHGEVMGMGHGHERVELLGAVEAVHRVSHPDPQLVQPRRNGLLHDLVGVATVSAVPLPDPHAFPGERRDI